MPAFRVPAYARRCKTRCTILLRDLTFLFVYLDDRYVGAVHKTSTFRQRILQGVIAQKVNIGACFHRFKIAASKFKHCCLHQTSDSDDPKMQSSLKNHKDVL